MLFHCLQVTWDPWGTWRSVLRPPFSQSITFTHRRVLFEGPTGRYWYLGERVCRQVYGNINAARVPHFPPLQMRHMDKLKSASISDFLIGSDISAFLIPDGNYEIFCHQFLMRPLSTGEPPEQVNHFMTYVRFNFTPPLFPKLL